VNLVLLQLPVDNGKERERINKKKKSQRILLNARPISLTGFSDFLILASRLYG
jgi:hypothetical protein